MASIKALVAALNAVEHTETTLDELAALVALNRLVRGATRTAMQQALKTHTPTEIARAIGQSRQSVAKRRATPKA